MKETELKLPFPCDVTEKSVQVETQRVKEMIEVFGGKVTQSSFDVETRTGSITAQFKPVVHDIEINGTISA